MNCTVICLEMFLPSSLYFWHKVMSCIDFWHGEGNKRTHPQLTSEEFYCWATTSLPPYTTHRRSSTLMSKIQSITLTGVNPLQQFFHLKWLSTAASITISDRSSWSLSVCRTNALKPAAVFASLIVWCSSLAAAETRWETWSFKLKPSFVCCHARCTANKCNNYCFN